LFMERLLRSGNQPRSVLRNALRRPRRRYV